MTKFAVELLTSILGQTSGSIFFNPTTSYEIIDVVSTLKRNKAPRSDDV